MIHTVQKATVLGAGVMGAGIAGLLASVGVRVLLLDVVPPGEPDDKERAKGISKDSPAFRNKFALAGLERIANPKTGMLYRPENISLIATGNMTDDMAKIADSDWIVEVAPERLEVKRQVMRQVAGHRKPGSIVSTNTSGVSIERIAEEMPEEFRRHFLGTHFFNPPRYMRLFEVIPLPDTLPEAVELMTDFARDALGKGIVFAKDTPNFISNRIGVCSSMDAINLMLEYGYDIPTVDQLTGPVIGRPKSAVFRTTDMVGLDILANAADNVATRETDPAERSRFALPAFIREMIADGALGDKAKRGFYQRAPSREILFWDWEGKRYEPLAPKPLPAVEEALASPNKYETIAYGDSRENRYVWELLKKLLIYAAAKVPEIADDYAMIDKGMIWGYNWEKGPFAIWDAIGVERSVERMRREGETIPAWVLDRIARGQTKFYAEDGEESSPYIRLDAKKAILADNANASLRDIGDGVLCLEFHSKGNAIDGATLEVFEAARERLADGWKGMVVGNRGKFFSAGADLRNIAATIEAGDFGGMEKQVRDLQMALLSMKYAPKPVVAAPFGMTLGGGAECVMHATAAVPGAETYMGLVETGVGLLPGGGGCKELLIRSYARCGDTTRQALLPALRATFRTILTAAVSAHAYDAMRLGFVGTDSRVIMNPDALLDQAKKKVLELTDGYMPPPPAAIPLLGDFGRAALQAEIEAMFEGGYLSEYDRVIAKKLAFVLTGGDAVAGTVADEATILELERKAFVSLCREEKTGQRIAHMLAHGKPLRN